MLSTLSTAFLFLAIIASCNEHKAVIKEIGLFSPDNNVLKVAAAISYTMPVDAYIKYWRADSPSVVYNTPTTVNQQQPVLVLTNLHPLTKYQYKVVTTTNKREEESKVYDFVTNDLPFWLKDAFPVLNPRPENLPSDFKKGYILLYKREEPGIIYLVNYKGEIVWYHKVENTGFKVAHFTNKQTMLSILGDSKYETSYGNQLLEISLTGDTLLNLKKGVNDFKQTIHHEALLTPENNIATITVEEKVMDLSAIGGGKQDSIKTDGIILLDREGKKLWHWTVFDVLDPLKEKNILKERKDWMHANSLTFAPDGNILISFYNNGQVWKINASTGALMWKFGAGGDFRIKGEFPEQCHAVHYTNDSTIMLFDNGVSAKTSHVFKFILNEKLMEASTIQNITLPKDAYNERMGSAYEVGDSSILICVSKRNSVLLTKPDGTYLWVMNSSGISPYRAEFISHDAMKPYVGD